jgi:DNA anti-recombination protein RmuC
MTDALTALAGKVSDLYREVVTTSVRFDELRQSTDKLLCKLEATVEQLSARVALIHDEHVREKAALEAQIATLQGRLNALSEEALHSVVRDVAREIVANSIRDSQIISSELLTRNTSRED